MDKATTQRVSLFPHYVEHIERKRKRTCPRSFRVPVSLEESDPPASNCVNSNSQSCEEQKPKNSQPSANLQSSLDHPTNHEHLATLVNNAAPHQSCGGPCRASLSSNSKYAKSSLSDQTRDRVHHLMPFFFPATKFIGAIVALLLCLLTGRTCKQLHSSFKCLIFLFFLLNCTYAFCPSGCKCNDVTLKVECKNASLNVVPFLLNPGIKYLKLPCNQVTSLGQSLAFYPELIALDLSYNALTSINFSDFESQKSLRVLKLNNNKITTLSNRSFTGLDSINELFLNGNNIGQLELLSFENLESLLFLDLSNNKIKSLTEEELLPLENLEILVLNYNKLHNPNQIGFRSLSSLQKLEISGNSISSVPSRAFSHLERLLSLSLDKNGISTISKTAFSGLSNLTSLSIVDNRLAFIPRDALAVLAKLKVLDISGNMFQSVQREPFSPLKQLEKLRITRCPRMSTIGADAFSGLDQLKLLDMSHNARLFQVGDAAFARLHSLRELDLTACDLVFIQPSQMPQGHPTKLHLAGNPLHCNCSLLWLAKMPTNATFYLDEPTCVTPPELYGVRVTKVDLQKAGCETRVRLTAVGICIGVSLLGLLVIGLFLVWRWRKRESASAKPLPYYGSRRDRVPPRVTLQNHPPHPPFHTPPVYNPKHPYPPQVPFPQYSLHQCHRECQGLGSCPYSLSPATRPLLPPPTPSPTSHSFLPSEWLYPSPYEEDTHWYTTIGRDGREYLTGEPKRNNVTPSPVHSSSPSSFGNPPTTLSSPKLKRSNSTSTRPSPILVSSTDTPPVPGVPVTYI